MTILCADDFGMTAGISEGILALCKQGKLNAASVMTEAPLLPAYSAALLDCKNVQIGLHFNLTKTFSKKGFSRNFLMTRFFPSAADREEIAARLKDQMQKFEEIFGRPPDFIDGHHHIHVMPAVRSVFLKEISARYGHALKKPWIRQVSNSMTDTDTKFKAFVLNVLNIGFRASCQKLGFETNDSFGGIYSLTPTAPFERFLKAWKSKNGKTLIMCHPSCKNEEDDSISAARLREFKALSGETVG